MTEAELRKFLDKPGLTYFWSKIKAYIDEADSHAIRRYVSDVSDTAIAGWRIGAIPDGGAVSAIANLRIASDDLMVSIVATEGGLNATVLSSTTIDQTFEVGITSDGALYIYGKDSAIQAPSVLTVVNITGESDALCEPLPITDVPQMATTKEVELSSDDTIEYILSLIPEEASEINKLVDKALLDTVTQFEKAQREASDIQIQAEIDILQTASHTHANQAALDKYAGAGSSSVPVYIAPDGTPTACVDDFARDSELQAEATTRYEGDVAIVGSIEAITAVIPLDASASNQLADKAYVDAIGERLEARYLGSTVYGSPFPTYEDLFPPDGSPKPKFYYQGKETTPDNNDVTVVSYDTHHDTPITQGAATTRYRYDGTQWVFEYVINNNALSDTQLLAINSGITPGLNNAYNTHVNDSPAIHVSSTDRETWNAKVSPSDLEAERTARTNADTAIQASIANEVAAREAGDAAERAALTEAIAALEAKIEKVDKKGLFVTNGVLNFG